MRLIIFATLNISCASIYEYFRSSDTPPFRELPDEITELTNLKTLGLVGLNLKQLRENFTMLKNLDTLNLTLNKLTISKEMKRLKRLINLRYLDLFGNRVDIMDVQELKGENPKLVINSGLD